MFMMSVRMRFSVYVYDDHYDDVYDDDDDVYDDTWQSLLSPVPESDSDCSPPHRPPQVLGLAPGHHHHV